MQDQLEGRVWVVGDSVTTDAMYPGFAMKLSIPEAAQQIFYDLRPEWTKRVRPGDIVVAGRNFGLGSSRPVASLFNHLGVQALIAEEFNSLFLRNAINFGLPALTVPSLDAEPLPGLVREILDAGGILPKLAREGYLPADAAKAL
jgi:3-isopropylmalate/(R)-2-methylmalate dehydratase small subunit